MRSIRRLYFYLVAAISLEVVLWGLINLLRTTLSTGLVFPGADTLAQALALILVGLPILGLHWNWAQKAAASDPEEHAASLRAFFLYAVLLITLIPAVQNLLAFFNRTLVVAAGLESSRAFVGGTQSWIDNLIALALNLLAAAYFYRVVRADWASLAEKENFADLRRLYRFLWVLYALLMTIFGTQQMLRFLFSQPTAILGAPGREMFLNGLALALIGAPIWVYAWGLCQAALGQPGERGSALRLGVLYLLALAGVVAVLTTSGLLLNLILRRLLGADLPWPEFISQAGGPFSVGLPLAVVWAYYGRWLGLEIASASDAPRRAALKRIYLYILAIIGLVATFIGLALLLSFVIEVLTRQAIWGESLRSELSAAIATLLAGLPLWLFAWRPLQAEALASDDAGDHARRSLVRRAYLYLVIFATVIGGMISAIFLVYTLLFGFLDHRTENFLEEVFNGLQLLGLFGAFLAYHWTALRHDGGHAAEMLAARHAAFPVLVLESAGTGFAAPVVAAIQRSAPAIPVAALALEQGLPAEVEAIQAVILPATLVYSPPEALRVWLKNFPGQKIVLPVETSGWHAPLPALKNGGSWAAQVVRQMAEGQAVHVAPATSAWQVVGAVFAVLFGLQLLFILFSLGISLVVGG